MFFKKRPDESRRTRRPLQQEGMNAQPVFSYHARSPRTETSSGRRPSKLLWVSPSKPASVRPQPSKRSKQVLLGVLAILAAALVINSLFLGRNPSVVILADSSGRELLLGDRQTYQEAARAILASSLANTNKLTVDTARVSEDMKRQFPELEEVSVTLPVLGRQPVVYIQPAIPVLIFNGASGIFMLDESGKAVADALNLRREAAKLGLPLVQDRSGLPVTLGSTALPSDNVAFVTEVVGQLKAKKLKITTMTLPQGTSELDVRVEGLRYLVKFNLRGDARAEAGAFLAVKKHLEREGKVPSKYIDVRVDNRAYYR